MIQLLVFTLEVFGVAFVVGHSKVTLRLRHALDAPMGQVDLASRLQRWLLALMECAACCSWWIALLAYELHLAPPLFTHWWTPAFYCCATSLILARVAGLDEAS